ncbi:MAG: HD domain-containing protein [Clostridia bacterium]|nr:HD domain-containing protein [Clostridia bacterium]
MKFKNPRLSLFALFIAFCIMLNFFFRLFAYRFQLPMWLDCFGTALCAYTTGPVCGAIVGMAGNLLFGMKNHVSYIYGLTGATVGVIVGVAARKRKMDTLFGTMSVVSMATLLSVAIATVLNVLFYGGMTSNVWGDGVIHYLQETGVPWVICIIAGEFYIDFLDRLVTLVLLYLALRAYHRLTGKRGHHPADDGEEKAEKPEGNGVKALCALLALFLSLGAASSVRAEELPPNANNYTDYVQTVYSSGNGLPCGEANDIAQTSDGILWIGTYAGLYRYNGREFLWMDNFESVRNVNCLYVDAEGRLWIGTNDNGLSICIREKIANVVDQAQGLPSNSVRSIIQSADGYYYIGTTSSMQVLTLNGGLKTESTLYEVNYADDVAADEEGHVAAVTSNGRLFLLKEGRILSSRQITNGQEVFKSCCFDGQGRLLAGTTSNHIYLFDISEGHFDPAGMMICEGLNSLKDLSWLDSGELFISADNGVGYLDQAGVFRLINTNDFNNSIDNMLIDYQGNLWFTSSRLGLLRLAPSAFRDVYGTAGMSRRVVNTVVKWQGAYYIGTDKGLDAVDENCRDAIENDLTELLSGSRIRCIYVDASDHLWVCTYGNGLLEAEPDGTQYWYNAKSGTFGNRARLVTQLSDGTILAGGDTGISFIQDHQVQRTIGYAEGLINSMILTATEMEPGRLLVGTDGDGIAELIDGQVTRMLTRKDGLSSEVILRTVKDEKTGGLFIVTSNGMCYMDADGSVRTLDNFPYFNNYDVWIRNSDTLFVMSSAGIYVVDHDELLSGKEDIHYDLLDSRRGLTSSLTANSWNYYEAASDSLFLPCDTGVYIISPNGYDSSVHSYRMMVSSVKEDGKAVFMSDGSPITLSRSAYKVEIYPEIINYSIQDPMVGFYVEGFDSRWTILPQSSLSTITYTNLPSGSYTLHLAVMDSSGEHSIAERSYSLVKEKEFYDHPWFVIYLLGVLILAVAWFTWYIVHTRVQRTLEIQERELSLARQQIQMGNETIFAIAKAVDAKDERTSQHSLRVSEYSTMIAHRLGLSEQECESVRRTALMHDIGKIGIPDSILNKPAKLTDEEYAVMKSHTLRGAEILKDFTLIDHVVEGALHHHERYDGKGYPNGMKGEEIPLFARIIGVADAFDAMTANRVYRKQMDFSYVLGEIQKGRGTQFDPQMADILLQLIDEGQIDLDSLYPVQEQPKEEPKEEPKKEEPKEEPKAQ